MYRAIIAGGKLMLYRTGRVSPSVEISREQAKLLIDAHEELWRFAKSKEARDGRARK